MAKYRCDVCGYLFDEQQAGETFDNIYSCPICDSDKDSFQCIEEDPQTEENDDDEDGFFFEEADENADTTESELSTFATENVPEDKEVREDFIDEFLNGENNEESLDIAFEEHESTMDEEVEVNEVKVNDVEVETVPDTEDGVNEVEVNEVETNIVEVNVVSVNDVEENTESASDESEHRSFVIEKRQEFWKSGDEDNKEDSPIEEEAKESVSLNHLGSVMKVIGEDNGENEADIEQRTEDTSAYKAPESSFIQTFYDGVKPVKSEEEIKAEEEAANKEKDKFTPLWGGGMGTVQKIVGGPETADEPSEFVFEDNLSENKEETSDGLFDGVSVEEAVDEITERLDETAEDISVDGEEIADENAQNAAESINGLFENDENIAFESNEDIVSEAFENIEENVKETLENTEETASEIFEEAESIIPANIEDNVSEAFENIEENVNATLENTEEVADEITGNTEENVEEILDNSADTDIEASVNEEEKTDETFENVEEKTDEAFENVEEKTDEAFGNEEEKIDEAFGNIGLAFGEVFETMDTVLKDETTEEKDDVLSTVIDELTFNDVEEEAEQAEVLEMQDKLDGNSEDISDDEGVVLLDFLNDENEDSDIAGDETRETEDDVVFLDENEVSDTIDEDEAEYIDFDSLTAADEYAEAKDISEIPEDIIEENGNIFVANIDDSEYDEKVDDAVATEEIAEEIDDIIVSEQNDDYIVIDSEENADESNVAYSMIKSDMKYTVLYDNEAKKIFDNYPAADGEVSNGLENIILLPAQCNPLPLERNADVDTKTVIGALTPCPVEVSQPFCFSKLFLWGEHIPNNTEPEEYANQALVLVKGKEGHIPNLSSKEELREEVEIAKVRFKGTPVGIDLVAGRIEADLEACVYAKVDYVILNDVSSRILPYALRRARNYLNRVNSKLEILVCVEQLKDAQELAKILALGANFVLVEKGFDLDMASAMTESLKEICRSTGHNNVHDLNLNDVCTIDTDLAMYTDISHV